MYLSDFVVKTESLKEINGFIDFPDGWGSDEFTWFKIAMNGGIAYTPSVLLIIEKHKLMLPMQRVIKISIEQ
jgi:hypothetical protein